MVNCEYGKIYKLYSKQQNITYIGSTAMYYLSQRLVTHKSSHKRYLNNKSKSSYTTSFKILECEDYKIELLENYPCANKKQLKDRERYYIENNECVNKCIPNRTHAEYNKKWYQDNKERILEQTKEYNKANVEHKKEYDKKYREVNVEYYKERASQKVVCKCGCQVRKGDIAKHLKTKKHLDLVQNKDTIGKVVCECGCQITKNVIARHKKTKKHLDLVQNS